MLTGGEIPHQPSEIPHQSLPFSPPVILPFLYQIFVITHYLFGPATASDHWSVTGVMTRRDQWTANVCPVQISVHIRPK